jgi:aryl-alcohol dehydrogenase-like predicted oxidoreductase
MPHGAPASLRATADATATYARRFAPSFAEDFYRTATFGGVVVSSIGIGTYLGEPTDADDRSYEAAIERAIDSGINLVDTAANYRCQRSERSVGAAVQRVLAAGTIDRSALVLCTKGGYIPLDGSPPANRKDYQAYVRREFFEPGILIAEDLVAGGHCIAPRFLRYSLALSRQNLGVRSIDVYYLHNPEQQLTAVSREELSLRLRSAFMVLEEAADKGEIGVYGCATWNALRVPPEAPDHISLAELVELARDVAGEAHHFRAVQLPINLAMPEALRTATQPIGARLVTAVEAASDLGLTTFASATLMQGRLTAGLPEAMTELFSGYTTDAQRAIAFVRTIPGVCSALVGMKTPAHVDENVASAA